jgi:hypothetical protein
VPLAPPVTARTHGRPNASAGLIYPDHVTVTAAGALLITDIDTGRGLLIGTQARRWLSR